MATPPSVEEFADRQIIVTRTFPAPRERVFDAWTDLRQITRWWAPEGFTTTVRQMDVRAGGFWRYVMHSPDGIDYQNRITYLDVIRPDRLVYAHGDDADDEPNQYHVTVSFADLGNETEVVMTTIFASEEECERMKDFGAVEAGQQSLARLESHLVR